MDIRLKHYQSFREVYGFVAGDDALRFTAMLMGEVVDDLGSPNDFIGHAGDDNFIIISTEEAIPEISQTLRTRFAEEVLTHYNFLDREQGYFVTVDESWK